MQNIDGNERMCLRCMPLGWPCGGVEAIHAASPDTACPGLHRKPLDATTIGQLLAPYCPSGCRGNNKQNNNVKIVHYAGSFNGCGGLWRRAGTIMCALTDEGGSWLSQKPLNATIGQALTPTASIGHAYPWFWGQSLKKGLSCLNNNRGMTHQSDEKHL